MVWRLCHIILAVVIVVGSVVHTMLIDGTMGIVSKAVAIRTGLGGGREGRG
jgi:hypothetical protein